MRTEGRNMTKGRI